MRFSTKTIRVGQNPEGPYKPVIAPLHQSATFAWDSLDEFPKFDYTRCGNPTRHVLEQVLASLENGKHAICFGSGMAAIDAALSLLSAGDELLMATDIYGGTHRLAHQLLPKRGVACKEFDASDPTQIATLANPKTKVVIFESPTNPNLRIADIAAITKQAKSLGLTTIFDNTFASPYLQQPLDLGCDIVVHSTTKYISGHSDIIGGALITNSELIYEQMKEYAKTIGNVPSPFDCWLTLRGVKTLAVRMERHCKNALAVAKFLQQHPAVSKVHYPGLAIHADYEIATKQMAAYGGMLAFEIAGTIEDAKRVAESTRIFILAESLGGIESLLGYPALMSHATMTEEERIAKGIPQTMLRLSVGIEDIDDLIDDLDQALKNLPAIARSSAVAIA